MAPPRFGSQLTCEDSDEKDGDWKMVEQGNKVIKKVDPYYINLSNQYASLPAFSAPPDPIEKKAIKTLVKTPVHHQSHYQSEVECCQQKQLAEKLKQLHGNEYFDDQIMFAEDESTAMAKNDTTNAQHIAVNSAHAVTAKPVATIL